MAMYTSMYTYMYVNTCMSIDIHVTYLYNIFTVELEAPVQVTVLYDLGISNDGVHHAVDDERDDNEFPCVSHDGSDVVVHFLANPFHHLCEVDFGFPEFHCLLWPVSCKVRCHVGNESFEPKINLVY